LATAGRHRIQALVATIAILTVVWVAMVAYAGVRLFTFFHVGLSSCLPDDFPRYPGASLASIVISDSLGNCTVQYRTRDSAADVEMFFKTSLDQGDWTVTGLSDQAGQIRFRRISQPETNGYVQVIGVPGQTQFQIQIRAG
jgi:hypothetical protein